MVTRCTYRSGTNRFSFVVRESHRIYSDFSLFDRTLNFFEYTCAVTDHRFVLEARLWLVGEPKLVGKIYSNSLDSRLDIEKFRSIYGYEKFIEKGEKNGCTIVTSYSPSQKEAVTFKLYSAANILCYSIILFSLTSRNRGIRYRMELLVSFVSSKACR